MLRSLKLGKLFGIGIYLHWSFMILPAAVVVLHWMGTIPHLGFALAILTAVFGCVVLHELGHALMARCYGIDTRDITLYPIGGVARLERMSEKPWEELWIAVAGPAVNVVIAGMLIVGIVTAALIAPEWWFQLATSLVNPTPSLGLFFVALAWLNIFLALFNMLPAFPMDGGRVFRAVLSMWMDRLWATRIAVWVGMAVALCFGAIFALMQPLVIFIALFVILAGQAELRYLEHLQRLEDEELLEVIPVRRPATNGGDNAYPGYAHPYAPSDGLIYQPKIAVYTWDSQTGAWVKESYSPSQ